MRFLPRETFVPASIANLAYIDQDLAVGAGRMMLKPLVIARLLQLARPRAGETALVVGSGTGYGAAILAACGVLVTALEQEPALLAIARRALSDHTSITLVEGPLADGYAPSAHSRHRRPAGCSQWPAGHDHPGKWGRRVRGPGRTHDRRPARPGGVRRECAAATGPAARQKFHFLIQSAPVRVQYPADATRWRYGT
jgi:hypothetical protein